MDLDRTNEENLSIEIPSSRRRNFLDRAGLSLALAVLFIILLYLIFLGIYFTTSDINAAHLIGNNPDLIRPENMETLKIIAEQTTQTRTFVLEISKSVLLNLLLPILTAILGYIFGSKDN